MKERQSFSLAHLMKMMVCHWQWFLLSVVICLCAAQLYVNYVTPVYKISGKLLIRQTDNYGHRSSTRMLKYVEHVGSITKTHGVENEVEMLWSSTLMHDVVMSLKLYTDYRVEGWPKSRSVYATQPITVDLDPVHLDSIDDVAYDEYRYIQMSLKRKSEQDSTILVKGVLMSEDETVWAFGRRIKSLPAVIETPYGTLTFTQNLQGEPLTAGSNWQVTIEPPIAKALEYLGRISVKQMETELDEYRWLERFYFKKSGIVKLTLNDKNIRRGLDIINQMALSYNRRANADKNEVALHTEDFINQRIVSLGQELGLSDSSIVKIKQQSGLTSLKDAAQSLIQTDKFSTKLTQAGMQRMMIDDLDKFINQPENKLEIIPSNIGLTNAVSERMISQYNMIVLERKKLLRSVTEDAPQVKQLTAEAEELNAAIKTALQQAKQSADIAEGSFDSQYANYSGKVAGIPVAEKALADVGRQQSIKARLFKMLLQKREENSILLSSTADHGRLIDEPMVEGKVRPNWWMAHGIALVVGVAIPYVILVLLGLLRYKIRNRKEIEQITELPVIADVPMAGENEKGQAGIVVRSGVNEQLMEAFRLMRTNLHFMMKGEGNVVLFTSSTSGEGKTFNAANLAMSFALLEKKVVLCGLDIRKPALGNLFGLADKDKGISTLLQLNKVGDSDVNNQIQPSGVDSHLDLLLAGPVPPNPTELLARDSFRQIITILKKEYDYVVLDTAPVGLVTDTLLVSRFADVTICMCRAGYTSRYAVAQLAQLADENKLKNACFVFNGVANR